jgi:hypothetical protein
MLKKVTIVVGLVLLIVGCGESPESAYDRLVFNARTGNEDAFVKGFTPESAKLVSTMIALHRTYTGYTRNKSNPYANIVFEKVLSVDVVDEKFEGKEHKVAILQVTDGRREQKIRMIKMDDGWKVDVTQLESAKLVN